MLCDLKTGISARPISFLIKVNIGFILKNINNSTIKNCFLQIYRIESPYIFDDTRCGLDDALDLLGGIFKRNREADG